MTQVKERAVEIIQRIPEEKMTFIFNILQNAEKIAEASPTQKKVHNVAWLNNPWKIDEFKPLTREEANSRESKRDYAIFQEATRLLKDSHDEDELLPDEFPRVTFSKRIEL
jgi:hypothetical protein